MVTTFRPRTALGTMRVVCCSAEEGTAKEAYATFISWLGEVARSCAYAYAEIVEGIACI